MRFEPLWHSLSPCLQYDFSSSVINLLHAIAICAPPTPQHPRLIPISSWHGILRCPFGIMLHWFCCPSVHFGSHFGSSLPQDGKPQHLSPIFHLVWHTSVSLSGRAIGPDFAREFPRNRASDLDLPPAAVSPQALLVQGVADLSSGLGCSVLAGPSAILRFSLQLPRLPLGAIVALIVHRQKSSFGGNGNANHEIQSQSCAIGWIRDCTIR